MSEQKTKVKAGQDGFRQGTLGLFSKVVPRHSSTATTRTTRSLHVPPPRGHLLLVFEYAEHGDLSAYLHGSEKGWSGMPSVRTTVVVRGRPNAQQAAGREGGLKLMEINACAKRAIASRC